MMHLGEQNPDVLIKDNSRGEKYESTLRPSKNVVPNPQTYCPYLNKTSIKKNGSFTKGKIPGLNPVK